MMKASTPIELPPPVRQVLSRLPRYPGSVLLVLALNRILAPQLPADTREALRHRRLRIVVSDAGMVFDLSWDGERFTPSPPQSPADLTLTASGHDFMRLAARQVDPDMLFFHRRLRSEGDTELGLIVKNAIDAMDLPVLDPEHWVRTRFGPQPAAALSALRDWLPLPRR